jgi:hypothetical protein
MMPKHRQLLAPCPKASGNAFQALVDPTNDGFHFSFDGGDEKTVGSDENTIVIANTRDSAATHTIMADISDDNMEMHFRNEKRLFKIEERVIKHQAKQHHHYNNLNSRMDSLLQKMDTAWTENTTLCEAYRASREETAALRAPVDTLTKKLDENIAMTMPPSPDTMTSSTTMEEMTMPLSHIQHDIQDVLDAVRNPPGKRKRCTSGQEYELTMPTNR